MLQSYRHMFAPTKDFLKQQEQVFPVASHLSLFKEWRETADTHLSELQEMAEVPQEERETMNQVHDLFIEGLYMFLQKATNPSWKEKNSEEKRNHILKLLDKPQTEQRSQAWYQQVQSVLTASEYSSLYGSERQYASLVLSKSGTLPQEGSQPSYRHACNTMDMNALDWGIRFEPAIKQFIESQWNVKIVDSGRLIHPLDPKLAASPDGFLLEGPPDRIGRLVEIKCPLSRKIGEGIPFEYWCQMQIQMEVTDIDECMYIEAKISSRHAKQDTPVKPENPIYEGIVWLLVHEETYQMVYAYTCEQRNEYVGKGFLEVEEVPWCIESFHTEIVSRERAWYEGTKQLREDFWANVEKAKKGEFKIPEPSPKRSKQQACLISDSPPNERPAS
jgi:hypothetical protein